MSRTLTNLLPARLQRATRRRYFLRLAAVVLILATFLIAAQALLLVPTYLYARDQSMLGQEQIEALGGTGSTAETQEIAARSEALALAVADLSGLGSLPTASGALRGVLAVPHPGVALSGFTFSASNGTEPARLDVSGTADSRDGLRRYVAALAALSFVDSADLPISAYARESDIPFTVTLTGTLLP
jgi:Tfp pilus assembly protein PilN